MAITGAGGGIGSKIVERFLVNGDTIVALDRSEVALRALREAHQLGPELSTTTADIVQDADVRKFHDSIASKHGRVDVLVNCAGYYPTVPFEEMTFNEWKEVISINLTGTFQIIHSLLPLMKKTGWGRIINIGSASVFEGVAGQSHYVAAKAGIVGLTRSIAMEVGDFGITVNIVAPGLTLTEPVLRGMPEKFIRSQREARALKRDEQPADLAGPVFLLASPDADFITGQMLVVDGGKVKH